MALVKSRFSLGGEKLTDKKKKNVGLFDHYFETFKGDLSAAIIAAKGRYGYGEEGTDGYVAATPNTVPAPSTFWKVVTVDEKVGNSTRAIPKRMKKTVIEEGAGKVTYEGEQIEVTLDVAGRSIPGVFEERTRKVNGKDEVIANSDKTAVIPHPMLLPLLLDIQAVAADASRDDGGLGEAIHTIAKKVTDPANRHKEQADKDAARAAKPYCPIKDNWLPPEEHG